VTPADLGFSVAEYADAAVYAPQTRPGRFTVLEHLRLDRDALGDAVTAFTADVS
jgi:glycerol-1-phosphate dehydrogenase [NAD(P)+]